MSLGSEGLRLGESSSLLARPTRWYVFRITSTDAHLLATVDGHRSLSSVVHVAMTIAC